MPIYISTSCLSFKKASDVIKKYQEEGIINIELGSDHIYEEGIEEYVKSLNFNFLIHNYFPAPKDRFIINLASSDKKIIDLSIGHAKRAIDLCKSIKSPIYGMHSGYRVDPNQLGEKFKKNKILPYKTAFDNFVKSLKEILDYAEKQNVKLAIEPNVLSEFNVINGKNELLLMCEYKEIESLFNEIKSENLGILLDLGHLKVTSNWLKFDKDEFVDKVAGKVFEIHIHDNDGKSDLHLDIKEESWPVNIIQKEKFKNIPICLESKITDMEGIKKSLSILNSKINI